MHTSNVFSQPWWRPRNNNEFLFCFLLSSRSPRGIFLVVILESNAFSSLLTTHFISKQFSTRMYSFAFHFPAKTIAICLSEYNETSTTIFHRNQTACGKAADTAPLTKVISLVHLWEKLMVCFLLRNFSFLIPYFLSLCVTY